MSRRRASSRSLRACIARRRLGRAPRSGRRASGARRRAARAVRRAAPSARRAARCRASSSSRSASAAAMQLAGSASSVAVEPFALVLGARERSLARPRPRRGATAASSPMRRRAFLDVAALLVGRRERRLGLVELAFAAPRARSTTVASCRLDPLESRRRRRPAARRAPPAPASCSPRGRLALDGRAVRGLGAFAARTRSARNARSASASAVGCGRAGIGRREHLAVERVEPLAGDPPLLEPCAPSRRRAAPAREAARGAARRRACRRARRPAAVSVLVPSSPTRPAASAA